MNRPNPWNLLLGSALVVAGVAAISYDASAAEADEAKADRTVKVERLADLRDGETRTFGEGEHAIEATRTGNQVAITLRGAGHEDSEPRDLTCNIATDHCTIVTVGGSAPRTMVMVNKTSEGDGTREVNAQRVVIAGSPGEGALWVEGAGPHQVITDLEGLPALAGMMPTIAFEGDGQVHLRCPKGDTTMSLSPEEAKGAATYRCPRHDEELKEMKGERKVVRIIHRADGSSAKKE